MTEFNYTITDPLGIHARPAGLLAKKAAEYKCTVTISKDDKSADTRRLMALMKLSVKGGDTIRITVDGDDEQAAADQLLAFLTDNKY